MKIIEAVPTIVALTLVFNNSSVSIDFNYFYVSEVIHVSSCKKPVFLTLRLLTLWPKKHESVCSVRMWQIPNVLLLHVWKIHDFYSIIFPSESAMGIAAYSFLV